MNKPKELLAAGIIRDIRFKNQLKLRIYIGGLEQRKAQYKILERVDCEDGTILIRIIQQYNTAPLIELYE